MFHGLTLIARVSLHGNQGGRRGRNTGGDVELMGAATAEGGTAEAVHRGATKGLNASQSQGHQRYQQGSQHWQDPYRYR